MNRDTIQALAAQGLSIAQAARALGVTKGTVAGRARDHGIRFHGAPVVGPGCNSDQARKGWETRRARGWTMPPRVVPPVTRIRTQGAARG